MSFLYYRCFPLSTDYDVKALIRECHSLATKVKSVNLREFSAGNDKFVERGHQRGLKNRLRTRSMRDIAKKYAHFAKWEQPPTILRCK